MYLLNIVFIPFYKIYFSTASPIGCSHPPACLDIMVIYLSPL